MTPTQEALPVEQLKAPSPSGAYKKPIPDLTEAQKERLLSSFEKRGEDDCWPWLRRRDPKGYGRFSLNDSDFAATRVIYAVAKGEDPGQLLVCHSCDNPPCVNPKHLWLGTTQDNIRDCSSKSRLFEQRKTACPRGHPYGPETTYYHRGTRSCRVCRRVETDRTSTRAALTEPKS